MDPSNNAALARIWAEATPLSKFIEERAERLCREGTSKPRADAGGPAKSPALRQLEQLAQSMQFSTDLAVARGKARTATIDHLIAGKVVGLGRRSDAYHFERIDALFWIGADVGGDTVTRGGTKFVEIRVVMPEAVPSIEPKPRSGPGGPTKVEVIREAIVDYAKTNPALDRPPFERYRAYRAYISSRGYDPRRNRGFSDKTFEKYEREFRRTFK